MSTHPSPARLPLSGPIGRRVRHHANAIKEIAALYGVDNVRVFGSVARGDDRPDSDVDLLLDFPEGMGLFALGQLRRDLEDLLGVGVDVVPNDGIKSHVRARVEADVVAL
ncbi:MAG: nucleotidyltransferase family protein [Actinomycetales bacterium]